ncbi:alpha/beta fold hydrolase [Candidatus Peribacteria bacterium]|nr:alpha/beta fold hydrolase [Candidatus Peribacteria bacterium]
MTHNRVLLVTGLLLLTACAPAPSVPVREAVTSSSPTSSSSSSVWIEALPSTLSIPYFSQMTLVGTGLTLERIITKNSVYVQHAIHYSSNGLEISGILNIPEGPGPFPLLIFNHGHISPSIYTRGRGLRREQDYLAREGFAVLHTDYRGHGESDPSPMVENKRYDGNLEYAMDSANAILAMRAAKIPRIDADRVGMLGHSLGGGVTLAVLTARPDLVFAAVLYAPVHADVWENFNRWRREREDDDRTEEISGTKESKPDFWRELSPQTYLSKIQGPILLFQGDKDKDVPKAWSDDLSLRLHSLDKDISYVEYAGEGHEFGPQWMDFMKKTAQFFHKSLSK